MQQSVVVKVRDKNFRYIGEVLNYTSLTATARFNDVGDWTMTIPGYAPELKMLLPENNPGGGIVIERDGQQFLSAPMWRHTWVMDTATGYPVLTVAGGCDNFYLTWARVFPDPENPNGSTPGADFYQIASTDTESIMRDLVAKNLASTAPLTARRLPGLTQDTNNHLGKVQPADQIRFDRLDEALTKYAQLAPDDSTIDAEGVITNPGDQSKVLGFRIVQVGQGLQFQVYGLTKRPHVRFSFDLGNLASGEYATQGPTATFGIVGYGGVTDENGKTISANIKTFTQPDAIYPGRIETYVDGGSLDSTNVDAINQAGLKALGDGAGQVSATVTPIDTDRMIYGQDFVLGDFVQVQLPNLTYSSPIRAATLTVTPQDGVKLDVAIGSAQGQYTAKTTGTTAKVAQLSEFARFRAIFGG